MVYSVVDWLLLCIVTPLAILLPFLYLYSKYVYGYFQRRGVAYERPTFLVGNLAPLLTLKNSYSDVLAHIYTKHKGNKFVGFFHFFKKSILIIDRDLIKNVLVKDFQYFNGKGIYYNKETEPLTAHLFSLDGNEWKFLRKKISPAFTLLRLKNMFPTIFDVTVDLHKYLDSMSSVSDEVECHDVFIRYGIAVISSTVFGVENDVFKDKSSKFYKLCEQIMASNVESLVRNALMFFGADIARVLNFRIIPKDTHDFIMNLIKGVVNHREINSEERNDFIQILMQLKSQKEYSITMNELTAQAYVFLLAGFESISNTMSFFLYEMALNPKIQEQVLQEIDVPDTIDFETLSAMEYFDMAIDETLRKYPSLSFLGRVCSQDYPVPGTNNVIEKGTNVMISTRGLHFDPELFPEPKSFIPERFSKENRANLKSFSYMPFGDGPRICIGMKFGKLVAKLGLVTFLQRYRVERTPKTPFPLKFDVKNINTSAVGGIWIKMVPRTREKEFKN